MYIMTSMYVHIMYNMGAVVYHQGAAGWEIKMVCSESMLKPL